MPIVPVVNEQPSNTPEAGAGSVAPMHNYAPGQIQQFGDTMQNAGLHEMSVGQSVALKIQERMDDANVKAAENKFITSATDILHGDNGYMTKQGADAINAFDPSQQALAKAKKDGLDSLGNDIQKRMFNQVSQQHLVTLGGQMAAHRAQQRIEYSVGQSLARTDSMRSMAQNAPPDSPEQNKFVETGVNELASGYALKGIARDSDTFKQAERKYRTQIVADNVSRMMENGDYELADKYLKEKMSGTQYTVGSNPKGMVEQGNLPIGNRPIVKNDDGSISSEYSISVEDNGKEVLIPTVVDGKFLTPDGKKPPEGSDAEKAMFTAASDHYQKTGENLGKFDNSADADAYAEQLHSRDMSPKSTGVGVEADVADRLRRAIRGNLTRTKNIEQSESIFAPYQGKELRTTDLEDMLNKAGKIDNPEQRKTVEDMVRAKYNEVHTMQAGEYRDNLSDVVNYKAANHGSLKGVDPAKWGKLDASDQADLMKPPAIQTDTNTLYNFITKPETLTVPNVATAWGKGLLSKESFISLTEHAMTLAKDKTYVQEAQDVEGRINYFANQAGIPVFKTGKDDTDKAQEALMKYRIQQDIEKQKQQQKGKVTGDQVDAIIKRELTQQILNVPRAPLSPMRLFGNKTYEEKRTTFQIPQGATGVMRGDDGKLHYTDGKSDLGVAE